MEAHGTHYLLISHCPKPTSDPGEEPFKERCLSRLPLSDSMLVLQSVQGTYFGVLGGSWEEFRPNYCGKSQLTPDVTAGEVAKAGQGRERDGNLIAALREPRILHASAVPTPLTTYNPPFEAFVPSLKVQQSSTNCHCPLACLVWSGMLGRIHTSWLIQLLTSGLEAPKPREPDRTPKLLRVLWLSKNYQCYVGRLFSK